MSDLAKRLVAAAMDHSDNMSLTRLLSEAATAAHSYQILKENVEALLDGRDEDIVRVREGGGPEDVAMSLAVTMGRTRKSRDMARRVAEL